jgi:hypothetical protein
MVLDDRCEKILYALDVGFSDIFEGENVRELTLRKKTDVLEKSVNMMILEEAMNFSVFSALGSDHPSAEIYAIDFPSDLRASMYLLLGGYYRQAILCLRNWLEMRLLGVYYGFVSRNEKEYDEWKKGKSEGPFGRTLIGRLFGLAKFRDFDKRLGLRSRLDNLYSELSAFTHGGSLERYNLQSETDNVPRLNTESVELWSAFAMRVFAEIVIFFFVAYHKNAFSSLGENEMETLRNVLPSEYENELKKNDIF